MIFETLHDSAQRGELMLVDGGFCHWHLRRDGQLTIREIISTRPGAGSRMLARLLETPGASCLYAKCPADLPANAWYSAKGFKFMGFEHTPNGRVLRLWQLDIARHWRPNAGELEVIYCAGKNKRFDEIAINAGWRLGVRLPDTATYFRPYFIDQDWTQPHKRAEYMAELAKYRPWLATVLDWERWDQLAEVLDWAAEAAQYAESVIIIPKVPGGIEYLPEMIAGKPIRLGYSVPTKYAGTMVNISEFQGWPGGVHLLGGSAEKQFALYRAMGNVRSVDISMHNYHAQGGRYFSAQPIPISISRNPHWPTLDETGAPEPIDGNYEAFRRSCNTILATWRRLVTESAPAVEIAQQAQLWQPSEFAEAVR